MAVELSELPSDILNEAAQAVERMPHRPPFKADVMEAIARAILAERSRWEFDAGRLAMVPDLEMAAYSRGVSAERERCASLAYKTCAETRHVTLGQKCADAIRTPTK